MPVPKGRIGTATQNSCVTPSNKTNRPPRFPALLPSITPPVNSAAGPAATGGKTILTPPHSFLLPSIAPPVNSAAGPAATGGKTILTPPRSSHETEPAPKQLYHGPAGRSTEPLSTVNKEPGNNINHQLPSCQHQGPSASTVAATPYAWQLPLWMLFPRTLQTPLTIATNPLRFSLPTASLFQRPYDSQPMPLLIPPLIPAAPVLSQPSPAPIIPFTAVPDPWPLPWMPLPKKLQSSIGTQTRNRRKHYRPGTNANQKTCPPCTKRSVQASAAADNPTARTAGENTIPPAILAAAPVRLPHTARPTTAAPFPLTGGSPGNAALPPAVASIPMPTTRGPPKKKLSAHVASPPAIEAPTADTRNASCDAGTTTQAHGAGSTTVDAAHANRSLPLHPPASIDGNPSDYNAWTTFRGELEAAHVPGKRFRWFNTGPLSASFNALCDSIAATPGTAMEDTISELKRACAAAAADLKIPLTKSTLASKIKNWQHGGTQYDGTARNTTLSHHHIPPVPQPESPMREHLPTCSTTASVSSISRPPLGGSIAVHGNVAANAVECRAAGANDLHPVTDDLVDAATTAYPNTSERLRIANLVGGERLHYQLPAKTDAPGWNSLSTKIRANCSHIYHDPIAARAIDNLHLAIVETLCDTGCLTATKPSVIPQKRLALDRHIRVAKTCLNRSKKVAKNGAPSPHKQIRADQAILRTLQAASDENQTAMLTRKHHKMATTNPKKLADSIWGRAMSSDAPDCTQADCEQFFTAVFHKPTVPTSTPSWLPPQAAPLQLSPLVITPAAIRRALNKKGGSSSAPGIDGITYSALRSLPWIPELLAQLFNRLIAQQSTPELWRFGLTVLLHKGGTKTLENYRPITLTPTIAKIFHSIVAAWLEPSLTSSGIISTDVQKGFLMGISGAIEHDLVLDAALADAKKSSKKLFMVLVDLKNAFGSVPHQRIIWALARFGAPEWVQRYVTNLYGSMFTKMTCKTWSTDFLQVERGVLQGDTLSPLLFLLVMQIGLTALTASCPGYGYRSSDTATTHFLKCFADDLTIITQDVPKLQHALDKFEDISAWLGMEMKPSKCRSFGLSSGKYRKIDVTVNRETILNVEDAPCKFLGMQLSTTQTFKEKASIATASITGIFKALDDFPLPPSDKVAVYKQFALPKARWVLMVQDILPTALTKLNQNVEAHLKKWWRLPRSTSRDALRLAVGIPSLIDLAEQGQVIKYSIAQNSTDPTVQAVWRARAAKRHKPARKLLRRFGPILHQSRQQMIAQTKSAQQSDLSTHVQTLLVQGAWDRLTTPEDDRRWRTMIWGLPAQTAEFATKAALDVLPTRANLHRWRVAVNSICRRCEVKDTLCHTLNYCAPLLPAYKWRHNSVLQHLHKFIIQRQIPGQTILADLPGQTYVMPLPTPYRPDLVLVTATDIQMVELTIAFEANSSTSHARKATKYADLPAMAVTVGLTGSVACIEMGSRGIPSPGWKAWAAAAKIPQHVTDECASIALRASQLIWMHRDTTWPDPPLLSTPPSPESKCI